MYGTALEDPRSYQAPRYQAHNGTVNMVGIVYNFQNTEKH